MKSTLAIVFAGVFVGAVGYEVVQRTNPEAVNRLKSNVSGAIDKFMWTSVILKAQLARKVKAKYSRRPFFSERKV